MAGCTKKYTDPSSLRKHVKNHAVKDQMQPKKKARESHAASNRTEVNNLSMKSKITAPTPNYVYNNLTTPIETKPLSPESNTFLFDDIFDDIKKDNVASRVEDDSVNNTMNLQEMSKCIITLDDDNSFMYNFESTVDKDSLCSDFNDINFDQNDEYVSIECIKKILGEQNVDFIGSTLQTHLTEEYFNHIH